MGRDLSLVHRRLNDASGLGIVAAVAKAAMAEQRPQLDESFRDGRRIEVGEPEGLHAR